MTKHILLIGGGSGTAELLRAFGRVRGVVVSALVTTFDDGGSSGCLRRTLKIPAVGDLRKVVSAVLPSEHADALETRLPSGHAIGNLALAFLARQYGFAKAIESYAGAHVVPTSYDRATLVAKLQNGKMLAGEHFLDAPPPQFADQKVASLALRPRAVLAPAAAQKLAAADVIVVGPGSLLGSLLPHFAVEGFAAAFRASRATKIFVPPGRTEFGYRGESIAEMTARFPIMFDIVLSPQVGARWDAARLVRRLVSCTR